MTCDDVRDLLPEHLTGAGLDPASDEHLRGCAACREEADVVRALVERVRGALAEPDVVVTPPALDDVLAAARAANRPRVGALGVFARAAALLVAAGLGALADRALADRALVPVAVAPAPASASPVVDPRLREALAERPGGLAASLALLDVMSRPGQ